MLRDSEKKGFSLIELMVSLTIFSMVMVVSISTLLTMVDANAKAQALYTAMTNLSFAVDSMSREIRTAYDHYCNGANTAAFATNGTLAPDSNLDCSGDDAVAFTREKDNARAGYRLNNQAIEQKVIGVAGDAWLPITSPTTIVESFSVVVDGSQGGDNRQTHISLLIQGYVSNGLDSNTDFVLQTDVTQRILNY
jgi:prepilin-type N-terminal cleavage/methylation domain-containing protein